MNINPAKNLLSLCINLLVKTSNSLFTHISKTGFDFDARLKNVQYALNDTKKISHSCDASSAWPLNSNLKSSMRLAQKRMVLALSCFLCSLAGCASTITQNWESILSTCPTSAELGKFSPWDRLEIRVYGQPELSGEFEVSPRGTISFPRLGEIEVAEKRCDEIEIIIRDGLMKDYLRDPSVVCINREVSKAAVTVDGQVHKPGIIEFRPGLMLTDVIAQSGGPTNRAITQSITIVRKSQNQSESFVVPYQAILEGRAPNICMHPADLVYIQQSAF
jgi:polysaccharide export outer membrane protein